MKTSIDCLPCLLRQTIRTTRLCTESAKLQELAVQAVARFISKCNLDVSPPCLATEVYEIIENITGVTDPYAEKKMESNEAALAMLPSLIEELQKKNDRERLMLAVRFAIAGNIIDYGAYSDFDISATLQSCRKSKIVIDHTDDLFETIESLRKGARLLYLADNCGEIVFDSILVEMLFDKGFQITIAVKDGPIINDALASDAYVAGLDKHAQIIGNGTRCPGTVLDQTSQQFLEEYNNADLIISKGQGNFESLSEEEKDIFFLLTVKCSAAARHMQEISGCDKNSLNGMGEMVVFHSVAKV